jgi:hypothetical protein
MAFGGLKNLITVALVDKASKPLKAIAKNHRKALGGMAAGFAKVGKTIRPFFAALTGIGALAGGVFILGKAVREVVEQTVAAIDATTKLESVLKTTNHSAGLTSGEMGKMANELARVSTFSRTAITGAQALGATFTKIGRDTFPRAIASALDMSSIFGQTLQQSMIQLGTALNDPIRGVGRLMRIGVSFNLTQKKMIEDFVMMGDVASAQGVILEELEMEFGEASEALANTFPGGVRQTIAALGDLAGNFGMLISKIPAVLGWIQQLRDKIVGFATTDLVQLARSLFATFRNIGSSILATVGVIMNILKPITFILSALVTAIVGAIEFVARAVINIVALIVGVFQTAGHLIQEIWFLLTTDIWNYFRGLLNLIADGINSVITSMNKIPGVDIGMVGKLDFISTEDDDLKRAERAAAQDFTAQMFKDLDDALPSMGANTWDTLTDFFGVFDDNMEKQNDFLETMLTHEQELLAVLISGEELNKEQKEKLDQIAQTLDGPRFQTLGMIAGFFNRLEAAVGDLNAFFRDIGLGLAEGESQTEKIGRAVTDMLDQAITGQVAADIQQDISDWVTEEVGKDMAEQMGTTIDELTSKISTGLGGLVGGLVGGFIFNKLFKKDTPTETKPVPVKVVNWGDMTQELLKASARRAVSPMIASPGNSMMSSDFSRDTRF